MRPPRPASRLRFCVVGSRWESLGEGLGDPGGRDGRARGLGWCLGKRKGGKRAATSGCGQPGPCIPAPGARGRPKAERATLSCFLCHETRTPEPGKALGLCLGSPRERSHGISSVSRRFLVPFPQKAPPAGWYPTGYHPHVAKTGFSDAKREEASRIPYPF